MVQYNFNIFIQWCGLFSGLFYSIKIYLTISVYRLLNMTQVTSLITSWHANILGKKSAQNLKNQVFQEWLFPTHNFQKYPLVLLILRGTNRICVYITSFTHTKKITECLLWLGLIICISFHRCVIHCFIFSLSKRSALIPITVLRR